MGEATLQVDKPAWIFISLTKVAYVENPDLDQGSQAQRKRSLGEQVSGPNGIRTGSEILMLRNTDVEAATWDCGGPLGYSG